MHFTHAKNSLIRSREFLNQSLQKELNLGTHAIKHNPEDAIPRERLQLAAAYRLVAHFGLDDSIFTHISARAPKDEAEHGFLINPFGLRFDEVTASNLVTVNLDGTILRDKFGKGINNAGFTIHSAVHAARPDVGCILHTHTVAGVAISSMEEGLLPLNQWALQFYLSLIHI